MSETARGPGASRSWSQAELIGLVLVILLAAAARLYMLGDQSLWYDESDRVFISSLPVDQIFPTMAEEGLQFLPLYFLVQKPFVDPFSEVVARLPSAWFGILAVALMAQVGRLVRGSRLGLVSALLLALNAFHIWYSRDAGFYSVVAVSSLGSLYFFLRLLSRQRLRLWVGLSAFTALGICTHYFAFAMPFVQFVYLLVTLRRNHRLLRGWALSQALAFLPLLPWYALVIRRGVFYYGAAGAVAPAPLDILYTLWNFSIGYAGGANLPIVLSLAAFGSALLLGVGLAARRCWPAGRLLLLWLVLPVALAFGMAFRLPMYLDRYLMPVFPAFLILVAGGIGVLGRRARRVLLAGLVIGSAAATVRLYHDPAYAKEDWRGVAQYVEENERPGDLIMLLRYQSLTPLMAQYYRGVLPLEPLLIQDYERDPYEITEGYGRVWLIVPHDHGVPELPHTMHLLARCQPADPLDPESYSLPLLAEWVGDHLSDLAWHSDFTCLSLLLFEMPEGES